MFLHGSEVWQELNVRRVRFCEAANSMRSCSILGIAVSSNRVVQLSLLMLFIAPMSLSSCGLHSEVEYWCVVRCDLSNKAESRELFKIVVSSNRVVLSRLMNQ